MFNASDTVVINLRINSKETIQDTIFLKARNKDTQLDIFKNSLIHYITHSIK
jgi:hypothetical protein